VVVALECLAVRALADDLRATVPAHVEERAQLALLVADDRDRNVSGAGGKAVARARSICPIWPTYCQPR
jgi:hypothetical protein